MSFILEERPSDSSFVQAVWRNESERAESFISTAGTHWEMVWMRHRNQYTFTVRGPETKATPADLPADAEWLGITFKLGTFLPDFPPGSLLDREDVKLPEATRRSFWLGGSTWEFPTYENADTFVDRLVRTELLVRDPQDDALGVRRRRRRAAEAQERLDEPLVAVVEDETSRVFACRDELSRQPADPLGCDGGLLRQQAHPFLRRHFRDHDG